LLWLKVDEEDFIRDAQGHIYLRGTDFMEGINGNDQNES